MANRPRDPNRLAKMIVDIATGEVEDTVGEAKRNRTPIRGRAGGLAGGAARAQAMSARKRSAIATKAARARWKKV